MRKRPNVGGWTESNVEAVQGSTEARRKDEKGCTEVRHREEVPAFIEDEKYSRNLKNNRQKNRQCFAHRLHQVRAMKDSKRKRMCLWRKIGESEVWEIGDHEVWKMRKWQNPVQKDEKADERRRLKSRQSWSSTRQHRIAQKRNEWQHRSAAQKRSSSIHLGRKVFM